MPWWDRPSRSAAGAGDMLRDARPTVAWPGGGLTDGGPGGTLLLLLSGDPLYLPLVALHSNAHVRITCAAKA